MLTVWMDDWQIQCCGQPFSVGSHVEWTLGAISDRGPLNSVLGDDLARTVTHFEDHHVGLPEGTPPTAGAVRSIRAVRCRYGPVPGQPRRFDPVPGSTTFTPVQSANGWEPPTDDNRFVGYLIELDTA